MQWTVLEGVSPSLISRAARSKSQGGPVSDNLGSVLRKCRQRARKSNCSPLTEGKTGSTAKLSIRVGEVWSRACEKCGGVCLMCLGSNPFTLKGEECSQSQTKPIIDSLQEIFTDIQNIFIYPRLFVVDYACYVVLIPFPCIFHAITLLIALFSVFVVLRIKMKLFSLR